MRLSADLINGSLSYLNAVKERELDLRGHKIPEIENMGTAATHECLDLTDNDIVVLTNFPLMKNLRTILAARNRISAIHPSAAQSMPSLTTLQLEGNRLTQLADLNTLHGFKHLTHLVLLGNAVCQKENYKFWVLWRCPSLRFLDYQKIRDIEREKAEELFGTVEAPTAIAQTILKSTTTKFEVPGALNVGQVGRKTNGSSTEKIGRMKLTGKERVRVEELVRNAKSLQDIQRLENDLNNGRVPGGIQMDEDSG